MFKKRGTPQIIENNAKPGNKVMAINNPQAENMISKDIFKVETGDDEEEVYRLDKNYYEESDEEDEDEEEEEFDEKKEQKKKQVAKEDAKTDSTSEEVEMDKRIEEEDVDPQSICHRIFPKVKNK